MGKEYIMLAWYWVRMLDGYQKHKKEMFCRRAWVGPVFLLYSLFKNEERGFVMGSAKNVIKFLNTLYVSLLVTMSVVMVVLGCYQVVGRYLFGWNISWTEELIRFLFVGTVFYGIGVVAKNDSFIAVTIISDKIKAISPLADKCVTVFHILIQLSYFVVMTYFGWQLAVKTGKTLSPSLRLPFFYVNMCLPIGGLMGTVVMVEKLAKALFPSLKKEDEN